MNARGKQLTLAWSGEDGFARRYAQLRPRPGAASADVASHQRTRICAAMIDLAAERGYRAVTVRQLARVAGVSTRTFYTHFAGKEECFLATFDLVAARALRRIVAAQRGCEDRREWWRAALCELVCDPKAARLAFVEVFEVGEPALARMRRARGAFEAMIAEGFAGAPAGMALALPPALVRGLAAGVERVARVRVLSGRTQELPALADEIASWALCYCHPAVATLFEQPAGTSARVGGARLRVVGAAGRLADGHVPRDERVRILEATAQLAASEGYRNLTVPRIRAAAGVSRRCFDAHFADVPACFDAALEHVLRGALARAVSVGAAAGPDWPRGVRRAIETLLECFAGDPALARIVFVEVSAARLPGMCCRVRVVGEIAAALRRGAPAELRPSELACEASVAAVWGILHEHVAAGRTRALPQLAGLLSFLVLAPMLGPRRAVATLAAAQYSEARGRGPRQARREDRRVRARGVR